MTVVDRAHVPPPVDYPESDGLPIAESDWHRDEMVDLIHRLRVRYEERPDVYVTGNMFVYYEEGKPASVFAPDVMVVFGVPKTARGVYKLWEEGRAPSVVFEVSSRKTWREDRGRKRDLCARLGVAEYYLWDVRYEYLTPPLQGFRLVAGSYRPMRADDAGCMASAALGLRLCCEGNRLELYDCATGEQLRRPADAEAAARVAVAQAREAAQAARQAADAERAARTAAEAEVVRLRGEIARLHAEGGEGGRG